MSGGPVARTNSIRSRLRALSPLQRAIAALALVAGIALRVGWNDVQVYSRADEQVYVNQTRFLVENGWSSYPRLVDAYVKDSKAWLYPSPARWGYLTLSTVACRVAGRCEPRTLAWVSTAAGAALLVLVFLIGLETLSPTGACIALVLAVTSPLQLALGRRALTDEPSCAVILLTMWAALRSATATSARLASGFGALAVAAATLAIAVKESVLLLGPAFVLLVVVLLRGRPSRSTLLAFGIPPTLYLTGFALSAGGIGRAWEVTRLTSLPGILGNEYAHLYQSGPPHRVLLDQFILAPGTVLLAIAGVAILLFRWREDETALRAVAAFLVAALVAYGLGPSKNVRYAAVVDPCLRLLAASLLALPLLRTGAKRLEVWVLTAAVAFNALYEISIFHVVFVAHAVYDPVTENVLRALQVIPGG